MEGKTELKPKTGADEIRDLCIRISDKANELSKMAAGKLCPICHSANPTVDKLKDVKNLPPYFDDLRSILASAENSINETIETIKLVDL